MCWTHKSKFLIKSLHHSLNQSDAKLIKKKNLLLGHPRFSYFFFEFSLALEGISLSSDWPLWLLATLHQKALLLNECCLPVDLRSLKLYCADQAMPGTRLFLRPGHVSWPPDRFPMSFHKVSAKKTRRTRKTFNYTVMFLTVTKY